MSWGYRIEPLIRYDQRGIPFLDRETVRYYDPSRVPPRQLTVEEAKLASEVIMTVGTGIVTILDDIVRGIGWWAAGQSWLNWMLPPDRRRRN